MYSMIVRALRFLWIMAGLGAGVWLALWLAGPLVSPSLFASLGGSAIFVFGLSNHASAQPRALFGGHLGSAIIGIACYELFSDYLWVYVLAFVLASAFMFLTRTVHPPAAANPLIMICSHHGFMGLWRPVFVGVIMLALVAYIWSRLLPGTTRYPVSWLEPSPVSPVV